MKIGFIFRDPKLGGTSLEEIYTAISSHIEERKGIECENIYINNKQSFIQNLKMITSTRSDIYHHTGGSEFYLPFLRNKKIVNSIPDLGTHKHFTGMKRWLYGLFWVRLPCWAATRTTVISDFTRKDLKEYLNILPDQVIHCPVNPLIKPKPKKFNHQKPVLLVVGTAPHKNLERVFQAIEGIRCSMKIVGRLSQEQVSLLKQNNIQYENYYDLDFREVVDCYEASDILLFASTHEGFGLPIIEANAIGRPVITSNTCSMPEVADDAAILVDPYDVSGIRKAVLDLINDDKGREKLIKLGLENAKRFELSKIASQYVNVYESVI